MDGPLDLFSTTQTTALKCHNRAPLLYLQKGGKAKIIQACCNDWTCPRCGVQRAKKEYARIVHGTKYLYENNRVAFFYTFTCRGRELTTQQAEDGYMAWCNRLLTAMRTKCKRAGDTWEYAIVTERQSRGHPHSHAIITWIPDDTVSAGKGAPLELSVYAQRDRLWSDWLHQRIVDAGLGQQWDLTEIREYEGVSRYIAKYLFKSAMSEKWPKGWRRVRYSQSWPNLPEGEKPDIAFPLQNLSDWKRIERYGLRVYAENSEIVSFALSRGLTSVVIRSYHE